MTSPTPEPSESEIFSITDFAWFPGGIAAKAGELADLAQSEPWGDPTSEHPDDLSVLLYYLSNTTRRLHEQGKFEFRTDDRGVDIAAFNTGLFTENYEPIYGSLEANTRHRENPSVQPWVLRGWVTESSFHLRSFGDHLPEPATYCSTPMGTSWPINRCRQRSSTI